MSDSFSQANTDSNQIIYRFILKTKEAEKIDRPNIVAKEILVWTEENALLTQSLCQLILDRQDQVIEGQETGYVKRIVRSLVKYWETETDCEYYQHFQAIKDSILENQQVTTVLLRLHEILLQTEVVAKESLEDTILLESGLVSRQEDRFKIANPIYAEIFNSEWIKQQLNQISRQLISSSEPAKEIDRDLEKPSRSSIFWVILALIGLVGLGGILGLYWSWINFSTVKQCRLPPTDLDLAAKVLTACDRLIKRQPNNAEALVNRGKVSLVLWNASRNQARIDSAIADLTQAKELEPDNPRTVFYLNYLEEFQDIVIRQKAKCLPVSDRYQEVINLYQPWDKITTADLPIVLELGHFLVNREQNYQTATKLFNAVIEFDPNIAQAWSGKATAQFLAKDYFNAQASFNRALALDPDSYKLKYNLGSLWAKLGNYQKASELYAQATRIEPNFAIAWRDLGLSLYLQDRYQESALAFTQIIYRPNSESFQVGNKERELMKEYYERVEDCLDEAVEGLKVSCSQEDRIPVEVTLNHNGIFHNVIVHGKRPEPFFNVEHHRFFQCFQGNSQAVIDSHLPQGHGH
ncbi:tetratricopeptide repeat protein [Waterburya agarophytonicola K14]|uniref:Tetratricopeptide repeat protein n=1 Tax=Waterburya agarophytonicola KI4 TaxID=2874699 RepID=A0A964BZU1_9CYAN|nr:tetratricopeptide repeat protein [Waterburya agarophytonicola]MCC0179656.1 tetratricopeptide repeat protein [Waterburya agarophytonicola KI4]